MSPAHARAAAVTPIVIAHRGASGYVPEHTLTSYFIALQQGADYIEPDLVMTQDGVLIARHENEIGGTTDVASHVEFAARKTEKIIDGTRVEGWFSEDFTLTEVKTLRARERIGQLRPANQRFDGQFEIPTLEEILALVASIDQQPSLARRTRIGVYPETKHPSYFRQLGLPMEEALIRSLEKWGYTGPAAPLFLQSFEVQNLKDLRSMTQLPIIQLIEASGTPYDFVASNHRYSYADMIAPRGLADIATYADGIGVHKELVIGRHADGSLAAPTRLVADAHAQGLAVHAWTFRAENFFLPIDYRRGPIPSQRGDLLREITAYLRAGLDGFFTDQPDLGVAARDAYAISAQTVE